MQTGGRSGHLCGDRNLGGRVDTLSRLIVCAFFALSSCASWATGEIALSVTWSASYGTTGNPSASAAVDSVIATQLPLIRGIDGCPDGGRITITSSPAPLAGTALFEYQSQSKTGHTTCGLYSSGSFSSTISKVTGSCGANSTINGTATACSCNAGYQPDSGGTFCSSTTACKAASLGDTDLGPFTSQANALLDWKSCVAGCVHTYTGFLWQEGAAGWYGTYHEKATTTTCSGGGFTPVSGTPDGPVPSPAPPASAAPSNPLPTPSANPCASSGMCIAFLASGGTACVVCSQTGAGSPSIAGSAPAGAGSAPGTTSGNGAGGTTAVPVGGSVSGATTCMDGLCHVTTTVKDSTGTVVGVTVVTDQQTSYCAKNPGDPICVRLQTGPNGTTGTGGASGSGSGAGSGTGKVGVGTGGTGDDSGNTFGGACGSGFTCKGDAIQCAIAKDQLIRNCSTLEPDSAGSAFGAASAAGLRPSDHPYLNGTTVVMSGSTFDQTNILSGSCPGDQSFAVSAAFPSVVIPFSKMCTPAAWLGNILVGVTALVCLGIVFVRGN